jgi:hypothetical protein
MAVGRHLMGHRISMFSKGGTEACAENRHITHIGSLSGSPLKTLTLDISPVSLE